MLKSDPSDRGSVPGQRLFRRNGFFSGLLVIGVLCLLGGLSLPDAPELPPMAVASETENDRQFRAWAKQQRAYTKQFSEAELAPERKPVVRPSVQSPTLPQATATIKPNQKSMPNRSLPARPEQADSLKQNPGRALIEELKKQGIYADLKTLSGLDTGKSLPALERLTQDRSIDELHQMLGQVSAAGLAELNGLTFFVDKLREQGHGSDYITGWAPGFDCSGRSPVPGFTAIIRNPKFDVSYGLFFRGAGGEKFVFDDPAKSSELAEAESGCQPPRGFNPALRRNQV